MNCMSCKFATDKDKGALRCQRYPTSVPKNRHDWCGEYQEEGLKKPTKNEKSK